MHVASGLLALSWGNGAWSRVQVQALLKCTVALRLHLTQMNAQDVSGVTHNCMHRSSEKPLPN